MSLFITLLALYVAGLVLVMLYARRDTSEEGYLIAGRNRTWWQVMFSKFAASVGAGWFIGYSAFAYEYGSPLGVIFLGAIIGIILFAYWAVPRVREASAGKAYTQGDYVYARTQSRSAKQFLDIAVGALAILTLLVAAVGSAALLDVYGFMSYEMAVLFTMAVVIVYILLSGFKAVMLTDVLQGVLLIGILAVLVVSLVQSNPIDTAVLFEVREISILGIVMLMIFGFVSVFADPTRYQVTFAGSSTEAVRKGLFWTIVPFLFTAIGIYILGSAVYDYNPNLESSAVFPTALTEYLPGYLVPFGFLVFFIALMSTVDSYLYALASHTVSLFTRKRLTRRHIQIAIIAFGLFISILALLYRDVVGITILTGAVLLAVSVPMFYLIAGGRSGARFTLLLGGGFIGMFAGILILGLIPDAGGFVLLGFILGSLMPIHSLKFLGLS